MGLETATTISELVESWPLQSDKIRQGAGHLRTIKGAVKGSFPNITTPVTATSAALNSLPSNFSTLLAEILNHLEHKGSVKVHDLVNAPIPTGWALCDGSVVAGYGTVPDYRDRFLVGAGGGLAERATGGAVSKTTLSGGAHTPVIQGHALTAAENGPHEHDTATFAGSSADNGDPGNLIITTSVEPNGTQDSPSFNTGISGTGTPHTHGADPVAAHTHDVSDIRPPFYAVVWIVKTTDFVMPA